MQLLIEMKKIKNNFKKWKVNDIFGFNTFSSTMQKAHKKANKLRTKAKDI